jgi:hypothetical protein
MVVKYEDYKQFRSDVKIQYDDQADKDSKGTPSSPAPQPDDTSKPPR